MDYSRYRTSCFTFLFDGIQRKRRAPDSCKGRNAKNKKRRDRGIDNNESAHQPHLVGIRDRKFNRTAARGGVVVIPAFAVGRAQNLMYCIHLLKERGIIRNLPVYLNSPMAANATRIYHRHRNEHRLMPEQCDAMCHAATIINTPDESRALNAKHGPMVIIAASGMATGGRVVHHLKAFASDQRNTILFAGFQAGGTRGASIVGGATSVRIHGQDVPIRAEIASLDNLSAHADAAEIVQWMRGFSTVPRQTFITHGEPVAADAMRQRIERELGWSCRVPEYLESVSLD